MKFSTYLNESKESDLLKKLNQWKKDLRKMTKLYRSLEASSDPKAIRQFKEAHKYWITFRQNWEKWVNIELLVDKKDRLPTDIPSEEKQRKEEMKVATWQAEMSINDLFPETYSFQLHKHVEAPWELDSARHRKGDTRKNKIIVYQKAFKKAFDAIEDYIKYHAEVVNTVKKTERVNVKGINVLISGMKEDEDPNGPNMKRIKKFIQNDLPKAVELIKKEKIKQTLKGLTIELTLSGAKSVGVQSGAGGSYNYTTDWLRMYPMGMGSDSIPTIVHELGHRYYYRDLPRKAASAWEDAINKKSIQIKNNHMEDFWNKYVLPYAKSDEWEFKWNKKSVIPIIKKKEDNPNLEAIYLYLAHNLSTFFMDRMSQEERDKKIKDRFKERNKDEWIPLEFITDYARTNASEAFAETFKLWVIGKKGRLGEWTRAFFKEIVRSGGANIREENELIDKYLKEKIEKEIS
jgi:hypothetical protein